MGRKFALQSTAPIFPPPPPLLLLSHLLLLDRTQRRRRRRGGRRNGNVIQRKGKRRNGSGRSERRRRRPKRRKGRRGPYSGRQILLCFHSLFRASFFPSLFLFFLLLSTPPFVLVIPLPVRDEASTVQQGDALQTSNPFETIVLYIARHVEEHGEEPTKMVTNGNRK